MIFTALDGQGNPIRERTYYSVGGGFVVDETTGSLKTDDTPVKFPFKTGAELLAHGMPISDLVMANELSWRS
jgi:L-serine dehydratase